MVEAEKIISDDLDIANTFNCLFENAAKMRDIPQNDDQTIIQSDTLDSRNYTKIFKSPQYTQHYQNDNKIYMQPQLK